MSKVSYMTQEGYDKLKSELEELKTTGRSEVAKAIAEAREKGDLSENAEYDAAKDAQGLLELKINNMEKVMANAKNACFIFMLFYTYKRMYETGNEADMVPQSLGGMSVKSHSRISARGASSRHFWGHHIQPA